MKTPWIPEPGDRFGRFTVGETTECVGRGYWHVECTCDCGAVKMVLCASLRSGNTASCGCLHREQLRNRATTHGRSKGDRLYKIWLDMRQRCSNPRKQDYAYYGGRGISVDDAWVDFAAFQEWALGAGYASALTIERVDNSGPYSPGNCQWVDRQAQARNTRRNHVIAAFGERKLLVEWLEDPRCAVGRMTFISRIGKLGWDVERALVTPAATRRAA